MVLWSLDRELSGLENLSLIPGCAGAAPIQNIGAYGVELDSVLELVTCWDWKTSSWTTFNREECAFSYRNSRFKTREPDRYLITSVRLKLSRTFTPQLSYSGLQDELQKNGIHEPCARDVSEAVIRLRQAKLPDPQVNGNAGSFFKNPVVTAEQAAILKSQYPALPAWDQDSDPLLGAFFDYASSGSERDYILGGGLWVEVIEHGAVLLGGGVEREEFSGPEGAHGAGEGEPHGDKTVGLIRVGATYAFHLGSEGRWGLAPQAFLDITEGNDAWVLGVALGYTF